MSLDSKCPDPVTTIATDQRFQGKTIVITGAGGQFGREGCLYFCQRGARVAALDLNETTLQGTLEELQKHLQQFDFCAFPCNVTDASSITAVVQKIVQRFGRIDLLWNNAGYQGQICDMLEYDPQDFANVMSVNVTGMFIVLQAVAKQMKLQSSDTAIDNRKDSYSIVNTASVAGLRGTPGMIAYASSKAAVIALSVGAAKDVARHGIRVNAVSPALIGPGYMWERQNDLHAALGPPYFASTPEQVAQNKVNGVPMKRLGSVQEVLQSVAFLLSDDASYTTGTNLVVDGGMSAGMK